MHLALFFWRGEMALWGQLPKIHIFLNLITTFASALLCNARKLHDSIQQVCTDTPRSAMTENGHICAISNGWNFPQLRKEPSLLRCSILVTERNIIPGAFISTTTCEFHGGLNIKIIELHRYCHVIQSAMYQSSHRDVERVSFYGCGVRKRFAKHVSTS